MDTFAGIDERYASDKEIAEKLKQSKSDFYVKSPEPVRENFSQWKNIQIIWIIIPVICVLIVFIFLYVRRSKETGK